MSQSGRKPFIGTLLGRNHGISARADIEWERIMVQITFAFVIILGYLLSVGMSEAKQLAAESEKHQRINAILEQYVNDVRQSEVGEERAKRVALERELQLQKLLSTWASLSSERPLNRMLIQFSKAELVPLSDDLQSLPTGEDFQLLKEEVDRVFLSEDRDVAAAEVGVLVELVLVAAGFDLKATQQDWSNDVPKEVRELYSEISVANREACDTLALQILGDLTGEREDLVDVQFALVQKIAAARLKKSAALPLEAVDTQDIAAFDGKVMLEKILEELGSSVKLLPETATRFRGLEDPAVDNDQE